MTEPVMKSVGGRLVEFSDADRSQREADIAAFDLEAPMREVRRIEQVCGMKRWERDVVIASLPADHPQRVKAETAEADIIETGVRSGK